MNRYPLIPAVSLLAALSLCAACTTAPSAPSTPGYITAAVADSNRPAADTQRDANRKPAQTLTFAGVHPGEQIGELIPGGGYFTRIFSKAVGPTGHVYALVPPRPANAPPDAPDRSAAIKAIAADPNYPNISVVELTAGKIATPVPLDLVFTAQNYHDLHNIPTLNIAAFNKSVFDALKPGGLFVVLDHSAPAGSGASDTNTLHRIDVDTVKTEVMAAGFEFVASSDILANPADPRTGKVFDADIRGKTDQFILKFRKPKK
ncbi:MAG: class I SAM-dependent methyltransferase [Steroidobacteraceae bacterium]